jgi:metal-dependent HD superfamily phosphatase/phosphodiesterase
MGVVTLPSDLNQDSIQKILQDFYNDQDLKVTQVKNELFHCINKFYLSDNAEMY